MFTVCSRKFGVIAVSHDIATVQYSAHNLKVVGSNPTPATNLPGEKPVSFERSLRVFAFQKVLTLTNRLPSRLI